MVRGVASVCSLLIAGCVIVGEPEIETSEVQAGTTTADATTTANAEASGGESGSSIPPIPFTVMWAVTPETVTPPGGSAGTFETDVYFVEAPSWGAFPGARTDAEAFYASVEEAVVLAVPDPQAQGWAMLPGPDWSPTWCAPAYADERDAFAASELGQGLSADELQAAYEAAAAEMLTGALARARAARPELRWSITGLPRTRDVYFEIVRDDSNGFQTCRMMSEGVRELWEAVDFAAPSIPYFYTEDEDQVEGDNDAYLRRFVEALRLSGKPVYPVISGRFFSSGGDDPPLNASYQRLPYGPEEVAQILTAFRESGASGFIYRLDVDGCWNFEGPCDDTVPDDPQATLDAYWLDVFSPVLETFDGT